jgi:hypothetical protein
MAENIKVAVRVRPYNSRCVEGPRAAAATRRRRNTSPALCFSPLGARDDSGDANFTPRTLFHPTPRSEKERDAKCIIRMQGKSTIITNPDDSECPTPSPPLPPLPH